MFSNRIGLFIAAALLLAAGSAGAVQVNDRVENFRLFDHLGGSHELYYYSDAPAIALLVQANACEASDEAAARFSALQTEHEDVLFLMLNSSQEDDRAAIAEAAGSTVPVLIDDTQIIGESLAANQAGEAILIDPRTWKVSYRGAADAGLEAALTSLAAGESVAVSGNAVEGCEVDFPQQAARAEHASISYSEEIAPMLMDNCVSCHRQGGIGPWAMTDYNMVRGFSLMIREVVRTKRMPPWHADPTIGHWENDRSLTPEQTRTLVHWIEAGAPRGEGEDPLPLNDAEYPDWNVAKQLGEPDFIIDIPAAEIPATGTVDYLYHHVKNPVGRDVWVQASEILPGARDVLHHTITTYGDIITEGRWKGRLNPKGGLQGYVPGHEVKALPEGTGIFLPANATLEFQMHYTTTGKPALDESKLGLWFHEAAPEGSITYMFTLNNDIRIPPHAKAHKETDERLIPQDAILYSILPHAHYRGKAAEIYAVYPDGQEELLLSVPAYDFNWQTTYELAEPKLIPAGTTLRTDMWWDNSSQNPANPDPTIEVTWGEQSWEEMLFTSFTLQFLPADHASRGAEVANTGAD